MRGCCIAGEKRERGFPYVIDEQCRAGKGVGKGGFFSGVCGLFNHLFLFVRISEPALKFEKWSEGSTLGRKGLGRAGGHGTVVCSCSRVAAQRSFCRQGRRWSRPSCLAVYPSSQFARGMACMAFSSCPPLFRPATFFFIEPPRGRRACRAPPPSRVSISSDLGRLAKENSTKRWPRARGWPTSSVLKLPGRVSESGTGVKGGAKIGLDKVWT